MTQTLIIRHLGRQPYLPTWQAMKDFTDARDASTIDEIWLLEHDPVFTQGQNGKPEHVLAPGEIPIVQTDRGGQVTYHGPGQLMLYSLMDIKRLKYAVRQFVSLLENAVISVLAGYDITANADPHAPGVYVTGKKICSIGLRIRKGASYHGIALNVSMDLTPFSAINPCGFSNLQMTQIADFVPNITLTAVADQLIAYFIEKLGYTSAQQTTEPYAGARHGNKTE